MITETKTGTDNLTYYMVNGECVYLCPCGKIHKGEYAVYKFGHHNCLHESELMGLPAGENVIQALCPDCGMSWSVKIEREKQIQ